MSKTTFGELGNRVYDDAGAAGKILAVWGAVVATLLCIGLVAGGIVLLLKANSKKSTTGIVNGNSTCKTITINNKQSNSCTTSITYKIDEKEYPNIPVIGNIAYIDQQKVAVWYSPDNPNQPELETLSAFVPYLLFGLGLIIFISAWVWVYVTRKSKFLSAGVAGGAVANMFW
jgi:hypothetical protein